MTMKDCGEFRNSPVFKTMKLFPTALLCQVKERISSCSKTWHLTGPVCHHYPDPRLQQLKQKRGRAFHGPSGAPQRHSLRDHGNPRHVATAVAPLTRRIMVLILRGQHLPFSCWWEVSSSSMGSQKAQALYIEVDKMLEKGAIEVIQNKITSFHSRLF